jgi:hypothetical protein
MPLLVLLGNTKSFSFFSVADTSLELPVVPVVVAEIIFVPFEGVGNEDVAAARSVQVVVYSGNPESAEGSIVQRSDQLMAIRDGCSRLPTSCLEASFTGFFFVFILVFIDFYLDIYVFVGSSHTTAFLSD